MAEIDYIERRKLWDEVIKSKTNNPHLNEIQRQSHIHEHRTFQRMIIEQPAADVVEVVRCKDCGAYLEYSHCEHMGLNYLIASGAFAIAAQIELYRKKGGD